jgi:hypothetical protein
MRIGIGPRNDQAPGVELHSPMRTPDLSYTDWRYTSLAPGPWTQLVFSYGNGMATATVKVSAANQADASYRNVVEQYGVSEAFLTLDFPGAMGPDVDLVWTVGSFDNRYGTAGVSNAGKYDTYLFGRTRVAGEALAGTIHVNDSASVVLEHGIGAKLEVQPWLLTAVKADFLPNQGPVPQGDTFLHHAHAGLVLGRSAKIAAHYLTAWSTDDNALPGTPSVPGRETVFGAEIKLHDRTYGDGFLGWSRIVASHVQQVADAIEVIHSEGGWQLKNNYFGRFDPHPGAPPKPPDESGRIDTILGQYAMSLGSILNGPGAGPGPDIALTLFGMMNFVSSESPPAPATGAVTVTKSKRAKGGAEIVYTALPWLGVGARYDNVQPDLSDHKQAFNVYTGKLLFRTQFVTREYVIVQYSRYVLGESAWPAFPYNALPKADPNAVSIIGSMAW